MPRRSNAWLHREWAGSTDPDLETKIRIRGRLNNRDWLRREWAGSSDPSWVHRAAGRFASVASQTGGEAGQGFRDAGAAMREGFGEAREGISGSLVGERISGSLGGVRERIGVIRGLSAHKKAAEEAFTRELRDGYRIQGKVVRAGRTALGIEGQILKGDKQVGKVHRIVYDDGHGRRMVDHALATLEPDVQGAGIMAEINARAAEFYDRIGVDAVTVHANIDVGGAAWANQGFKFNRRLYRDRAYDTVPASLKEWADFLEGSRGEYVQNTPSYDWRTAMPDTTTTGRYARRDELLAQMGLTDAKEREKVIESLRIAFDGVNAGIFDPRDVYYTGYEDHQWTETLKDGRTVTMWPGKKAMIGTSWFGISRNYLKEFTDHEKRVLDKSKAKARGKVAVRTIKGKVPRVEAAKAKAGVKSIEADLDQPDSVLNNHDLDADEPTAETLAHLAESQALVEAGETRPPEPEPEIRPKPDEENEPETKDINNRDWIRREWAGEADPAWVTRNRGRFASTVREVLDLADTPLGDGHVQAAEEYLNRPLRGGYALVADVRSHGPVGDKHLWVHGSIVDTVSGRGVGKWRVSIKDEEQGHLGTRRIVDFDEAVMDGDVQGGGIVAEINARAAEFYDRIGVDAVRLHANYDVGGATWASQGFDWDEAATERYTGGEAYGTVAEDIQAVLNVLSGKGAYSKEIMEGMGLADDPEVTQRVVDGLRAAHAGVLSGHYSPRDVYYTGYDVHQFTQIIGSGDSLREVVLWPGKLVLLGSSWHGINRNYLMDFLDAEKRSLGKVRSGGVIR